MERPAHLMPHVHRFPPRNLAAISGALLLEAAAIYAVATGLTFGGIRFIPPAVEVDFFKTRPPEAKPVVLPQLKLVKPPVPTVPPPEIQIRIPKPPPRIAVARIHPHRASAQAVQITAPAAPPAPPKPQGITAPVSIGASHSCEHEYPALAVRLDQQGTTTIRFTVNSDGHVSNVHVVKSSGHETLDDAAVGCAAAWRYRPALENGQPVAAAWTANVQWKLHNGSVPA